MEQIVKTVVMLPIKNTRDYGRSKQSILEDVTKLLTNCSMSCYNCMLKIIRKKALRNMECNCLHV